MRIYNDPLLQAINMRLQELDVPPYLLERTSYKTITVYFFKEIDSNLNPFSSMYIPQSTYVEPYFNMSKIISVDVVFQPSPFKIGVKPDLGKTIEVFLNAINGPSNAWPDFPATPTA